MALKETNKNRKKKLLQPGSEWSNNVSQESPPIQTDTTIWFILIICLVVAFFAAL